MEKIKKAHVLTFLTRGPSWCVPLIPKGVNWHPGYKWNENTHKIHSVLSTVPAYEYTKLEQHHPRAGFQSSTNVYSSSSSVYSKNVSQCRVGQFWNDLAIEYF